MCLEEKRKKKKQKTKKNFGYLFGWLEKEKGIFFWGGGCAVFFLVCNNGWQVRVNFLVIIIWAFYIITMHAIHSERRWRQTSQKIIFKKIFWFFLFFFLLSRVTASLKAHSSLTLISYYIALIVWWRYYGSSYHQRLWFIHGLVCCWRCWPIPAGTDSEWIECVAIFIAFKFSILVSFLNFICRRNDSHVPIGMRKLPVYVLCVWLSCLVCCCWLWRSCGHKSWRRSTGIFPRWMDIEPLVSRFRSGVYHTGRISLYIL